MAIEQIHNHLQLDRKCIGGCPLRRGGMCAEHTVEAIIENEADKQGVEADRYQAWGDCAGPIPNRRRLIGKFLLGDCQLKFNFNLFSDGVRVASGSYDRVGGTALLPTQKQEERV